MTSRDFCYWLQGVFEVGDVKTLSEHQTSLVRAHLAMVFKHEIDPSMGPPEHQAELDKLHEAIKEAGKGQTEKPVKIGGHCPGPLIMRC
jgi:hypothetical protein